MERIPTDRYILCKPAHPALVREADLSSPPRTLGTFYPSPSYRSDGAAEAPVPPRRTADLRWLRTADGIRLVQRQARLPVPPPRHRHRQQARTGQASRTPTSARTGSCHHLAALHLQPTEPAGRQRQRRTRRGADVRYQASPEDVIGYLREHQITLTYDPASGTLHPGAAEAAQTITLDSKLIPGLSGRIPEGGNKKTAGRPALAEACAWVTSRMPGNRDLWGITVSYSTK